MHADEPGLTVEHLEVGYGDRVVVRDVSFAVAPGEIVALIGPSGCGKTTLLRAIAGLEPLRSGAIRWAGRDVSLLEPHRRSFGMMFQDHALFPHRNVAENVVFALRMHKRPAPERDARVRDMLDLVGLAGFDTRRIDALSGGEAQRVALARALAAQPRLLMLDEPLGALDRALRERLAIEIRQLLVQLGVAAIHVTHDQGEAFAVADRIGIMRDGQLLRCASPEVLWHHPELASVARFIGHRTVLDATEAAAVGLLPRGTHPQDTGVLVLPGALFVDDAGPIDAVIRAARFGLEAQHLFVDIAGVAEPIALDIAHGDTRHASATLAPGRHLRLGVDASRVRLVRLDG
jgi:thiamine transport system ATP-binding protein